MLGTRLLCVVLLSALTALAQSPKPKQANASIQLVYEMPMDALQRSLQDRKDTDLEKLLAENVSRVEARLASSETADVKVTRNGATGFSILIPTSAPAVVQQVRDAVETVGRFEQRIAADPDYVNGAVKFDLAAERARLQEWLDRGGRERVLADAKALDAFHADRQHGPLAGANLRWYVHRVKENPKAPGRWLWSMTMPPMARLREFCVPLFAAEDWNDGAMPDAIKTRPAPLRELVELIAVNMDEAHFENEDFDPKHVAVQTTATGEPAVVMRTVELRKIDYATWSERHVDHFMVSVWRDEVLSVARIVSRIPGACLMQGLSQTEAETMRACLLAPPLAARPELMSKTSVPK
jgi:hypothetical protein